jgi:hypothetical protein
MGDDPAFKEQNPLDSGPVEPLSGVLKSIVERLREPPLLFALGVLVVLAIVAALSVKALHILWIPAVALAVIALAAWLISSVRGKRESSAGARVRLRAKDIGEKGVVHGIEGLPVDRGSDVEVDMNVRRSKGRTVGITAHPPDNPPEKK